MGNYNPSAPQIMGNEWVGIRDEDMVFSPSVNVVEYGTTFKTAQPYTIQDARFYLREMPLDVGTSIYVASVYAQGTEAKTGPIKKLVMPCASLFTTGSISSPSNGGFANLLTPEFANYYALQTTPAESSLSLGFNVAPYTILQGKRIVDVSVLLGAERFFNSDLATIGPLVQFADHVAGGGGIPIDELIDLPEAFAPVDPIVVSLGDTNRLWQSPTTSEVLPWNFADLLRFDPSTALANRLFVNIRTGQNNLAPPAGGILYVWYAALQVSFCEETRILIGTRSTAGSNGAPNAYGASVMRVRDLSRNLNPVLPSGSYTLTLAASAQGSSPTQSAGYPDLNALRELYTIPGLQGIQIAATTTIGAQFTAAQTHVLPQLSLHASGGPLVEVHSYGRQYPAQIYGNVQATQEIYDNTAPGSFSYPQIRFWARHWNGTTQALTVSGTGTAAGAVASISVADFDALPEILDGWKQVDLRFPAPPTMGSLTPDPNFVWLSPGEAAGSRWELLAMEAPAVSGVAGNLLQLVQPASQQVGVTTYQPPVGQTVELTALSMYASGAPFAQYDVDAAVLFSQDPVTITGLTVTTLSQTVTGIGTPCDGTTPCCIPTAIYYNRVTWSAYSGSVTGFGALELQRFDSVGNTWNTIMMATGSALTGFNDFEARVGIQSAYRIRALNLYRFAGAWSAYASGTATAPGVVMNCQTAGAAPGVLIFTSNEVQAGVSNLAYAMQFDREVEEAFTFVEASQQQLRRQYGRDYQVAYRPTERGGESFTRTILVQGAAVAVPNMADMHSLRNLGWQQLSYVCVRDELGNRWFANVLVPNGTVTNRALYLAQVTITAVTATPTQVSP